MAGREKTEFLYGLSHSLHEQHLNLRQTLQTVIAMTGRELNVAHGCLVTFRDHKTIENAYIIGSDMQESMSLEVWDILLRRGLVGFVYHSDRLVVIRNIETDPRWPDLPDLPYFPQSGSAVGVPLRKGAYVYGVMLFLHSAVDYFDHNALDLLKEIAEVASLAIGNALDLHAARTSDTRYQALFDDAIVPIVLTDMRGFIVDVNRKASDFFGQPRSQLMRLPITQVHELENDYDMDEKMHQLQTGEEAYFRTLAHTLLEGNVPVMVRARRIKLEGRDIIEWVEQDISAQMELEQLRRDLTAMVYHDMRGPLQTILGSIYKLGEVLRNHENPAVLTLLQLGIRGTRQLEKMVDSLLDVQRLEAGQAILDTKPVELRVMLADAMQLVQPMAAQNHQRLQFEVEDNLPLIIMDADMMMRVVINLLQNAIKYTPDHGIIKLSGRLTPDVVVIGVTDSGPGIPETMKAQIFDKYSRIKYKDAPKGVGLGLAFCRLAVEAHEGRIWVESDGKNGSHFQFTLPLITAPDDIKVNAADETAESGPALATTA